MFDLAAWWRDFTRAFKELKVLSVQAVLLAILNVGVILQWNDIAEMTAAEGVGSEWAWPLVACAAISLMIIQETIFEYQKAMAKFAIVEMGSEIELEIDESIINRWEMVWDCYDIDPDEPRAEIECFMVELRFIQALEEARKMSKVRATRQALGARVLTIMHECLGPLALQIRVYDAFMAVGKDIVTEEEAVLAQCISTINDDAVEVHAEELLRIA